MTTAVAAVLWLKSMGLAVVCWRILLDLVPCTCVYVCVRACVCACTRARVHVCVRERERIMGFFFIVCTEQSSFFLSFLMNFLREIIHTDSMHDVVINKIFARQLMMFS